VNTERIFGAELVGWGLTDALKNVVRGAKKRQGSDETAPDRHETITSG
jgi:hypothetical protein